MLTRVRRTRFERGLSQKGVARRLRISPQALSRVEGGYLTPWPALRRELAALYQVPEAQLWADLDEARDFLRRRTGEVLHEPEAA